MQLDMLVISVLGYKSLGFACYMEITNIILFMYKAYCTSYLSCGQKSFPCVWLTWPNILSKLALSYIGSCKLFLFYYLNIDIYMKENNNNVTN